MAVDACRASILTLKLEYLYILQVTGIDGSTQ